MTDKDKKVKKVEKTPGGGSPAGGETPPGGAGEPAPDKLESFFIVGIGASAGGLEALEDLFQHMPGRSGMAFVVITHLHPGHASMLPDLLAKKTQLTVEPAADQLPVQPDHVYVASPGVQLSIENGSLQCRLTERGEAPRMPINFFLRSLAQDQGEKAVCIILSGTGSDGTLGLQAIKEQAGMVMVQEPGNAKYAGMPESAVHTGLADFVLSPAAMPAELMRYRDGRSRAVRRVAAAMLDSRPESMSEIYGLLSRRVGYDFSEYKVSTIHRRVERRMALQQVTSYVDYVAFLQNNPEEVDKLFHELLIGVTGFFRDPEAWAALQPHAETLVGSLPDGCAVRAWVPGCCTGEEVYSLVILLHEAMVKLDKYPDVQVFGTDIDPTAIERARMGQYSEDIVGDVTPERLGRYFVHGAGSYRVRKDVRDMAIFAQQNVIKDPPFTKLDMICCRNLLIYFQQSLQSKLMPLFHYALKPEGLLLLGPSETVGQFGSLFETEDKRWKIYSCKPAPPRQPALPLFPFHAAIDRDFAGDAIAKPEVQGTNIGRLVERALLNRFAPASVIVTGEGDIVYVYGRTGAFLEPAEGKPRNNILEMARRGLQFELVEALKECSVSNSLVVRHGVRITENGNGAVVDLSIEKLKQPGILYDLFLVTLQQAEITVPAPQQEAGKRAVARAESDRVQQLERELRYAKESNQITLEELETSNEELKSINEELQSTNEELQSTNEELETSREELHSLNEELTTVNAELQAKVMELSQTNDDMQNLLNSTYIATIFLDNELNIKRFTDQARDLVSLRLTDIGRPISELAFKLQTENLFELCREVLGTLVYNESEVRTRDNRTYLLRIMPYRTARNVIEGLVLTFVEISRLKRAQRDLHLMSQVFLKGIEPIILVDLGGEVINLNELAASRYGCSADDLAGQSVRVLVSEDSHEALFAGLQRCCAGEDVRDLEIVLVTRDGHDLPVTLTLRLLTEEEGPVDAVAIHARHPDEAERT